MTDHSKDVQAIHDAFAAAAELLSGVGKSEMSTADWLETVRGVREKVQTFALFVPNAGQIEHALDTAEKLLLGFDALARIKAKV
jgi:hypothetical protein